MRLISAHDGKLLTLDAGCPTSNSVENERAFSSGIPALDAIAPGGGFSRGAIHELLTVPEDGKATFIAMLLARASCSLSPVPLRTGEREPKTGFLIWCDPARTLYPLALGAHGFPLDRLLLLHPKIPDPNGKDLLWAMTECLRCKGVSAVVGAAAPRLSRLQARRLQLAAETGGGVGLLLRHAGRDSLHHASASRWLIRPAPGGRTFQRWTIQLLHGHGGRIGQTLCLEHCRETNHLHPFDPVADRSVAQKQAAG
ncbi:MAG TPA: hypothetical protein VFE47_21935 [Tepidisphaeraceae bacterium]|nr:hypothetical protein [Tepidisphaeraceae bacterium]